MILTKRPSIASVDGAVYTQISWENSGILLLVEKKAREKHFRNFLSILMFMIRTHGLFHITKAVFIQ